MSGESRSRFVPLWRVNKKSLLALLALAGLVLSSTLVYAYEENVAPTPVISIGVDIFYNSTSVSTATIKTLSVSGRTVYINKLHLRISGAPGLKAFEQKVKSLPWIWIGLYASTDTIDNGGELNDVAQNGKTDADYFLIDKTLETWNNDTTYYSTGFLDNTQGKLLIYTEHLTADKLVVKVNNTVYYNETGIYNHTDDFWWLPLPQGKLANITITGVKQKTVFVLAKAVWYTLDHRFVTADSDLYTADIDTTINTDEETWVIGTEDFDAYIRELINEQLKNLGYNDLIDDYIYNVTDSRVGFAKLSYNTIEASVLGFIHILLHADVQVMGWDLGSVINNSVKRLHLAISGTVNTVVKRVQNTAETIKKTASNYANFVSINVKSAVKKASDLGKTFVANVQNNIKAVGNFYNKVSGAVSKAVKNFASNVVNTATNLYKSVTTSVGQVFQGVQKFFGGIVSWFKKFWWVILIVIVIIIAIIAAVALQFTGLGRRIF